MRHRLELLCVAIAVTACVLALPAASAQAALGGARWPGRTITYYDATRDHEAVARGVAAWNDSGVRMRFVRTTSRRRAQLLIRNSRDVPGGCGTGRTTLGYLGRGRQARLNILHNPAPKSQRCSWTGQTLVVAHELGHVLGLLHEPLRCSIMNPGQRDGIAHRRCLDVPPDQTSRLREATWRCRLLEPADVRLAIRRYGGTARPVRADPWCDLYTRVAAPTLSAAWDPALQAVVLRLVRPAPQPIAPFLRWRLPEKYEVHGSQGACVTRHSGFPDEVPPDVLQESWTVAAGAEQQLEVRPAPGTWCWSAWARDALGKPGHGPSTATVVVPEPGSADPGPADPGF